MKIVSSRKVYAQDDIQDDESYTLVDWAEDLSYIAYRQGYDLEHNAEDVDMGRPEDLELRFTPNEEMMPEVEVHVKRADAGGQDHLYLEVNILNFPDLYADKMEYHDSWTWQIKQWAKVGKLADDLVNETFVLR